jgi:Protein of unknown function (DUF3352)
MRSFAVGVFASLALLLASGCGGSTGSATGEGGTPAADFVPPNAPAFVSVNTDFGSDQWTRLNLLLQKFPDREQLFSMIQAELSKRGVSWDDVKAALGPETAVAVLKFAGDTGNALALTEPKDKAKLDALIAKLDQSDPSSGPTVKEEVDGWTLLSDVQSVIEAGKRAHDGDSLADDDTFKGAFADLPADALVKFYVAGPALQRQLDKSLGSSDPGTGKLTSLAGDVAAKDDGIGFDVVVHSSGEQTAETYTSQLVDEVPAGALLYASFKGADKALNQIAKNPRLQTQLGTIQGLLGVSFSELTSLFEKEGAIYVRPGAPFPEVTIALQTDNERAGLAILDRLAGRLAGYLGGGQAAPPTRTTISGVPVKKLPVGPVAIYYAAFDGKLVITDSPSGISGLKERGQKLSDDPAFKGAKAAAGMPDETAGFLYVNVKDSLPLIENFAQTAGQPLPAQVSGNLEPLRSFLAYGTAEKGKTTLKGFLEIK